MLNPTKEESLLQVLTSPTTLFMTVVFISLYVPNTLYLAIIGLAFWPTALYLLWNKYPLQKDFFKQPEIICLMIFCGYCLISLLWSPWDQPVLLLKEIVRVCIVLGLIFLFGFIAADRRLLELDIWWIVILSVSACYLLPNISSIEDLNHFKKIQKLIVEPGLFYHHSPLAWMFGLAILLSVFRIASATKYHKIPFIISSLLALSIMVCAQSRGAYLGLVAGLCIFAIAKRGKAGLYFLSLLAIIVLAFFSTYLLVDIPIVDSLINRGGAGRRLIYSNAWIAITDAPWFGHGFGASSANTLPNGYLAIHFHSLYLSVVFYGGLTGLLMMLATIGYSLAINFKSANSQGWYSVFIMALVIFLFDGNHFVTYPSGELYILIVPILIMAASRILERLESSSTQYKSEMLAKRVRT